ncbi:MAG: NAD(P)/FAD-dependent oxidoreductase [Desulfobulbaceae bacterium]|nr:NAD(P)/FAD-dependent oxidoreductase [Desulfobulbaceae bacterium]
MSDEKPDGAILQRDKATWAIVPRTPTGLLTPEFLENLARVVRQYDIPITKITSGQRLALVGVKAEEIEAIRAELNVGIGRAVELCLHYVQACPGNSVCSLGVRDSLGMGQLLEQRLVGVELPAKLKIGVSGCPMTCSEGYVRDLGLIGKNSGWIVTFGGNSGGKPRIADVIGEGLSDAAAVALVDKLVEFYRTHGKKKERTARMVERLGLAAVKAAVLA